MTLDTKGIVLLACGSYNPITNMHLRMFEVARDTLLRKGHRVIGGIVSPVNDNYRKKDLQPAKHRCQMVELALRTSDWIKLDKWEAEQDCWLETAKVLRHHQSHLEPNTTSENNQTLTVKKQKLDIPDLSVNFLNVANSVNQRNNQIKPWDTSQGVRVKLLCGADLLESFNVPGLWKNEDILEIVSQFGLVVVTREGTNPMRFIYENDVLFAHQNNIHIVTEWISNEISSTHIRRALRRGESVRYLIQDPVISYIKEHNLYIHPENKYSCFLTPSPNYDIPVQFAQPLPAVHSAFAYHENDVIDVEQETAV